MKNSTLYMLLFILLLGCDLGEINENPNVPLDAPLSTLLPPAQKALTDAQGRQLFQYVSIFAQQMQGVDQELVPVENYEPDEAPIGNVWSDLYVDAMINTDIIIERADEEGSPHYAGIARVLQVQTLGLLTDTWGNVPFTQALQGAEIQNPEYDNQEFLYDRIQSILDRAISDLEASESVLTPSTDDIMYGGNLNDWIAAAHVLKARYHIHTTKRRTDAASMALEALQGGFTSSSQDWLYPYLGTGTDLNPLNSFFELTPYAEVDTQFVSLMESLNDPRLNYAFDIIPFTGGRRRPGEFYANPDAPVKLASYLEQLFIRAEALLRTGDTPGAQTALQEAVLLSMNQVSFGEISEEETDAYLNANAVLDDGFDENLETIIVQKYIALFTTPEPWTDFRRTGYPELEPNENGTSISNPNGEIPRRLIYPQSERLRNTNFPSPAPNMQDRFWWDQ